jgi:hypothetical protein
MKPLIVMSVPWAQAQSANPELANWEAQDPAVFHRNWKHCDATEDLAIRKGQEFYPVAVYLPSVLAAEPKVRDLVSRLVVRLLFSLVWYKPKLECRDWIVSGDQASYLAWQSMVAAHSTLS